MQSRGIRHHKYTGYSKKDPLIQIFKQVRDSEGLNNQQLADLLELKHNTLTKMISGLTDIRGKHTKKLLEATGFEITLRKK